MRAELLLATDLRRLARDLVADLGVLDTHADSAAAVASRPSPLGAEALAFLAVELHAWFTGLENNLERIARTVEGSLPGGPSSHQDLLRGMTLELPDVRPAVLSPVLTPDLAKLLSFRHFFRHPYAVVLDEERLRAHATRLAHLRGRVRSDLEAFAAHCLNQARRLEVSSE
jgi:hypothetical protein